MGRKPLPSLPSGFKTKGLFGRPQVTSDEPLNNQTKARKRAREEAENAESEKNSCESDTEKENKRKNGSRENWGDKIDIRFGSWISKIPYVVGGKTKFMAGCHPCAKTGATKGLGAKPTKRIKMYTFKEHQESTEHKKVLF